MTIVINNQDNDNDNDNRQIRWELFRSSCFGDRDPPRRAAAGRDRINSTTKFHIRWTENSVNADVLWRSAGAPRRKGTIFHYGGKEMKQNKIVFASTVIITARSSKIQLILQSIRFLTWKRLLQLCFV
jgi:hypothetical protein